MSALVHTLSLVATAILVFCWLQSPLLEPYSLQAFAASLLIYFAIKRLRRAKLWHLTPQRQSWEMVVATFGFLLVIGATGDLDSPVFALIYIHLFFLVLSTPTATSIIMALVITLFHYLNGGYSWETDWPAFISLPILTVLFLFAKQQHEESVRDRMLLEAEEQELAYTQTQEQNLELFLANFMHPKLEQLKELMRFAEQNKEVLLGQVTLLQLEIQKVLTRIKKNGTS